LHALRPTRYVVALLGLGKKGGTQEKENEIFMTHSEVRSEALTLLQCTAVELDNLVSEEMP